MSWARTVAVKVLGSGQIWDKFFKGRIMRCTDVLIKMIKKERNQGYLQGIRSDLPFTEMAMAAGEPEQQGVIRILFGTF